MLLIGSGSVWGTPLTPCGPPSWFREGSMSLNINGVRFCVRYNMAGRARVRQTHANTEGRSWVQLTQPVAGQEEKDLLHFCTRLVGGELVQFGLV